MSYIRIIAYFYRRVGFLPATSFPFVLEQTTVKWAIDIYTRTKKELCAKNANNQHNDLATEEAEHMQNAKNSSTSHQRI